MRSTQQMRDAWEPACSRQMVKRPLVPGIWVEVAAEASEAVAALGYVIQWCGYHVRGGKETGAYNCRPITGGDRYSLHAYGISVDINAYTNPYRLDRLVTDMPPAMVRGICRILTTGGARVWRWGGDFDGDPERPDSVYDAMHFEVQATPGELKTGIDWSTVEIPLMDARRPSTWPVVIPGDRGPGVRELQRRLLLPADGVYGPITAGEVREYQGAHGLGVDGIVGPATWCALLTRQPVIPAHAVGPLKASSLHLSSVEVG